MNWLHFRLGLRSGREKTSRQTAVPCHECMQMRPGQRRGSFACRVLHSVELATALSHSCFGRVWTCLDTNVSSVFIPFHCRPSHLIGRTQLHSKSSTRKPQLLLDSTGFHWLLLGFTRFYWVLLDFTGFYWFLLEGFHWVLFDFAGFYWVSPGFT